MGGNLCRPVATQFAESYTNKYYSVGTSCMNGRRKEMEDQHTVELNLLNSETSFFGVFDGHGGTSTSMFLKNHLHNYVPLPFEINDSKEDKKSELLSKLTKNMIEVDHQILSQSQSKEKDDSGSTAGFVLLKPNCNNYFDILVAHVGDSRVMVLGNDGKIKYKTNDHKPLNPIEHERIINAGGFVSYKNRINGNLAVSRAFGDASYKQKTDLSLNQQLVIAEPDIFTDTKICYNDIIILACDGIFEKLDYEQVADFVHTSIAINKKDVTTTCIDLINHSLELGSQDNMSVIIIKINNVAGEDLMAELARQKEKTRQKENELEQKRKSNDVMSFFDCWMM